MKSFPWHEIQRQTITYQIRTTKVVQTVQEERSELTKRNNKNPTKLENRISFKDLE